MAASHITMFFLRAINIWVVLFLVFTSCDRLNSGGDIKGSWKGSYLDHEVEFVFSKNNTCSFQYFDEQSNEFEKISGVYSIDYSKDPIPLSIQKIPQLSYQLHTIVEFVDKDSIRMAPFSPKWRLRPVSFEYGQIKLRRETLQ